jgi:hypothetical protein
MPPTKRRFQILTQRQLGYEAHEDLRDTGGETLTLDDTSGVALQGLFELLVAGDTVHEIADLLLFHEVLTFQFIP